MISIGRFSVSPPHRGEAARKWPGNALRLACAGLRRYRLWRQRREWLVTLRLSDALKIAKQTEWGGNEQNPSPQSSRC